MGNIICCECGNQDEFYRVASGWDDWTEKQFIDGEETVVNYEDREYGDGGIDHYGDNICDKCKSEDVEYFPLYRDLVHYIHKHRMKNGEWSIDEIPENERDENYLAEEIAKLV